MHQTATTWERDLFLRRAANNPNRRPPPRLQIPQQGICLNRQLPPEAQKGPGITASGRTVVTRTVVRTVKCAIAIDPARDGAPGRNAVALSAFLADNPSVFGQCRSRRGACVVEKRHRERSAPFLAVRWNSQRSRPKAALSSLLGRSGEAEGMLILTAVC